MVASFESRQVKAPLWLVRCGEIYTVKASTAMAYLVEECFETVEKLAIKHPVATLTSDFEVHM